MRDGMNMHLGDALNLVEKALSASENVRRVMLDDALQVIRYVMKEENNDDR